MDIPLCHTTPVESTKSLHSGIVTVDTEVVAVDVVMGIDVCIVLVVDLDAVTDVGVVFVVDLVIVEIVVVDVAVTDVGVVFVVDLVVVDVAVTDVGVVFVVDFVVVVLSRVDVVDTLFTCSGMAIDAALNRSQSAPGAAVYTVKLYIPEGILR